MESTGTLPSGMSICCSLPDIFFLPELVFGGLVWILVACTHVIYNNPQGYVMAVSLFCFCMTFIWMVSFLCGAHRSQSTWAAADTLYHGLAALLYLSASVLLAFITIVVGQLNNSIASDSSATSSGSIAAYLPFIATFQLEFIQQGFKTTADILYIYRLNISAVVFSFLATLLYTIHAIISAIRWKSF